MATKKITTEDMISDNGASEELLCELQNDINKSFGTDVAMRLDSTDALSKFDYWVSTRSIIVDSVLRGGRPVGSSLLPFGRQVEISGPESSGKTTLCAQIAAETQSKGGIVLVSDTEERIDEPYWNELGVNVKKIIKLKGGSLSEAFNVQTMAIHKARDKFPEIPVLLIWDSLGGTQGADFDIVGEGKKGGKVVSPMEQAEKFAMRRAAIISQGMELINQVISKARVCYLYTNHEYTKMGISYGSNRETRGGNKPKYFATVRLQMTPIGQISEEDPASGQKNVIGQKVLVKALKNSMSGILLTREATLMAHKGFVNEYSVLNIASDIGLIKKGTWSTWVTTQGEEIKFQGFGGFMEKVVTNEDYSNLLSAVMATL